MRYLPIILLLLSLLLLGCERVHYEPTTLEVRFCQQQNCTEMLVDFIEQGKDTIYCAFFELKEQSIIDTLLTKKHYLVVDSEHHREHIRFLNTKFYKVSGLMHTKICAKGNQILFGSANPTPNGLNRNDNHLIIVKDSELARKSRAYILQLYNGSTAGNYSSANNAKKIQLYFCPFEPCEQMIVSTLQNATKSIHFMTFSFTAKKIANVLLIKHQQNLTVEGVFERTLATGRGSVYKQFLFQGISALRDGNAKFMHHKVFIIDENVVIVGSYNPTNSARDRNIEVLGIIHNKQLAQQFMQEYQRIKHIAENSST